MPDRLSGRIVHRDRHGGALARLLGGEEPAQQLVLVGDPPAEHDVRVADAAAELVDVLVVATLGVLEDVVLDPEAGALGEAPDLLALDLDQEGELGERVDGRPRAAGLLSAGRGGAHGSSPARSRSSSSSRRSRAVIWS